MILISPTLCRTLLLTIGSAAKHKPHTNPWKLTVGRGWHDYDQARPRGIVRPLVPIKLANGLTFEDTTTTKSLKPFFHQAAIDNMAEHQRPYVPAKTLSTEYPVSPPLSRYLELVLSFLLQSSSTVTRTYISTIISPMFLV